MAAAGRRTQRSCGTQTDLERAGLRVSRADEVLRPVSGDPSAGAGDASARDAIDLLVRARAPETVGPRATGP